ncbi:MULTISPECIES: NmrA family NAD(P)-binding protein [Niastella]|uniref:NmrA family NAD(P)-binding protein n=1 Tax=Niastella soli TaxID=2821487 RepID=A0ABS3YTW4_9BACT|nr:NmrA family NAD(P)-binding protein [Niastella soli]MBO9201279.1 NmrA family NAD(P)-binding protein [Niastella soli]
MKITITGSLGNISRPLTEKLVAQGHEVQVISSDANKAAAIRKLQATPLIGSIEEYEFVKRSFEGSDAVYLMIPPNFSTPDYKAFTITAGKNYARAIQEAGISYVVNLSSSGSPLAGQSPLVNYQNLETFLDELPSLNILHLRPGGFYTNFYGSMGLIRHQGIIGNNYGEEVNMVLSHPEDIADAAAKAFSTLSFTGKKVQYIISDTLNGRQIAQILGAAIGKPELTWVPFTDEQLLQGLLQNGFSKDAAQHYIVDMGIAIREGLLAAHYAQHAKEVSGSRNFIAFAEDFARVYQQQG